jgi:tetratricopeptide (TPR) repeat protein
MQKKFDAALGDYEAALKLQPESVDAIGALVRVDLQQKQPKRALARLDAVIGKYPDNALARHLRGEVLMVDAQTDAAVGAFDAAIERAPTFWMPYRGKALARLSQKRDAEAIAILQTGVEKTGAFELAGQLSALQLQAGHPDEAIKVYEDAVKRNPRLLPAANNLAMLLVTHRSDKASLDRAAQLADILGSSGEPTYLDTRGWVKYKRGDYQPATGLLQQAVDKAPAVPDFRFHLGMALIKSGNPAAARENLEAALKSGVTFDGMDEARSALKSLPTAG